MSQGLPPRSSQGVLAVSTSITIDAPRDVVWRVLMDWQSYSEWNPFVRNQCLTDPSKRPLPEQTPRAGAHLLIYPVHIPPSFDPPKMLPASSAFQVITTIDPENYRCAWEGAQFPAWLLSNERWQALVEVVEDGRRQTRYETIEVFDGLLAHAFKLFLAGGLQSGFNAMAEGLKRRSENVINVNPPLLKSEYKSDTTDGVFFFISSTMAYPPLIDPHMSANITNPAMFYDPRGRQKNYTESAMQRKERIEFLKQREWVRRVAEWVKETNAQNYSPNYGRPSRSYSPFSYPDAGVQASAIPFPCVEEEEPYIIYSSSPSSSLSSLSEEVTPVLPLNCGPSPSLSLPVAGVPQPLQRRTSGHHRRCSSASLRGHTRKQSLSSICEVPEED